MQARLRKWMPMALCCLPGIAVAAAVGIGLTLGGATFGAWLGGPLGVGLIALALLACPISMGLMMRRRLGSQQESTGAASPAIPLADCCLTVDEVPAERVARLRARRKALEREVAAMEARGGG